MKRLLSALILIVLLLCACSVEGDPASPDEPAPTAPSDPATEPPTEAPTEAPTDPPSPQQLAREHLDAVLGAQGHGSAACVDVPELYQYPDLPTGCETVALTIALRSFGCEISAAEFASRWLIIGSDIIHSFVGDPFAQGGAGIYPPGLVASAERYIEASGATLAAFDLTGTDIDGLYRLLDSGVPVVVWTTYYFCPPRLESYPYEYDGHTVYWYDNEHCVCLYGYDEERGVVLISDPLQGKVAESAAEFADVYDAIGRMAMVLIDTSAL